MSSLPNTSNLTEHIHLLQDQSYSRMLSLVAQPGPLATGTCTGRKEDYQQCPFSHNSTLLKHHSLCTSRTDAKEVNCEVKESSLLDTARDWTMVFDLDQELTFPPEIITTSLSCIFSSGSPLAAVQHPTSSILRVSQQITKNSPNCLSRESL